MVEHAATVDDQNNRPPAIILAWTSENCGNGQRGEEAKHVFLVRG
jgi:hypothetical protein